MGFYNAEKYIQRSILSVMSQNFKDYKCYITSDKSTDNSVDLVNQIIKNDERFELVEDTDIKLYQTVCACLLCSLLLSIWFLKNFPTSKTC